MNNLYHTLLLSQFVIAILVFVALFFINAPYGRFVRKGWGFTVPARWAWIIQEFPAFATILICFIYFKGYDNPVNWVFIIIWELHYFQRTFIYPFKFASAGKSYPVLLVIFAVVFNIINGFINGYYLFNIATYTTDWFLDIRFIIGVLVFVFGYFVNKQSDRILIKTKEKNNGKYGIPSGGMFNYVSSAHYFGEWLEWTGWAILTWSLPGLAFSAFTFANLAPRAVAHHKWYKDTFEEYPKERKVIIPFIW